MASRSPLLNVCGRELVRIRTAAGVSQEKLAAKCQLAGWDISRAIIANIELGRRVVADGELAVLARVLGAPLEEFFPREIRSRLPKK